MNNVNLIGRLVRDPELRFLQGSGTAVANFTMAVDKNLNRDKKKEFESQGKPTCDFIRVVVWNKQAENCSQYLAKGRMVAIQGSIQTGSYKTPEDEVRYTTEVLANRVQFLEWGDKSPMAGNNDDLSFNANDFEDFQTMEDLEDVPF